MEPCCSCEGLDLHPISMRTAIMAANRKGPSRRRANQEQQGQQDSFSAIELLKEDHREVQACFEEYGAIP